MAALALPDDEGGWSSAGELVLPATAIARVLAPEALAGVDPETAARWGEPVLAAVGCLSTFALLADHDVALDPDATEHDLDAEDEWAEAVLARLPAPAPGRASPAAFDRLPPTVARFVAVRDLDLVADDAWPQALALMAADPDLRAAVVEPARVQLGDGRTVEVPSYPAWWLGEHALLGGRRPVELRAPGSDPALARLLPEAPALAGVDPQFLRAIGMVTSPVDLAAAPMCLPLLRAGVAPDLDAAPEPGGVRLAVPAGVERVLPAAATEYVEHDELTVQGVACDWWVDSAGTVHAATLDGLARGLAWAAGRWEQRLLLAAVLAEPERTDELLAEAAWDE